MQKQDEKRILTAEMVGYGKIRNDDNRQALSSQTTLLGKVVQQRLEWFGCVERMTVDRIPHNALHARFEGKKTKADHDYDGLTIQYGHILWRGIKTGV